MSSNPDRATSLGGLGGRVEDWRAVADRVRNWGRWGPDDELGTLNYITPEKIRAAAGLVRRGKLISLSIPVDGDGPQPAGGFRSNPVHVMSLDGGDDGAGAIASRVGTSAAGVVQTLEEAGPFRFNDDIVVMPLQSGTQWDAIAHVYYDGLLYNGYPARSVTSLGAARNSIAVAARRGAIVTRGVLLDVARFRGVDSLPPNTAVEPAELASVAETQGVRVEEGDALLVRLGWWPRFVARRDAEAWRRGAPGLSWRCAEWLHERRVAVVAADNFGVEVQPSGIPGARSLLHMLCIRDMGMMLGEIWDLEELGQECAADGVYEFLLTAQPLVVTGGVGSPVNPVAIK